MRDGNPNQGRFSVPNIFNHPRFTRPQQQYATPGEYAQGYLAPQPNMLGGATNWGLGLLGQLGYSQGANGGQFGSYSLTDGDGYLTLTPGAGGNDGGGGGGGGGGSNWRSGLGYGAGNRQPYNITSWTNPRTNRQQFSLSGYGSHERAPAGSGVAYRRVR